MQRIRITKKTMPDKYWLKYTNENTKQKHIYLSACADSFTRSTGYKSQDCFRAVGWRYIKDSQLCYELFSLEHCVMYTPLKPDIIQVIGYFLRGKEIKTAHQVFLRSFEEALNQGGWKTVEKEDNSQ